MKYTIINSETGAEFIQQPYDTVEEAEARLAVLKAKFGDRYALAVGVADEGGKPKKEKEEKASAPTQPIRPRPGPRK